MALHVLDDPALLRRLLEVARSVVSELDVDVVLGRVVEVACEITGARFGALGVLNERRDGLSRFITRGIDDEARRAIGELPRGRGVLGILISDPEPLRLADVGSHPRSYGFPSEHPAMSTFLGVPVRVRSEAYGNLYLTEKHGGGEFTDVDEQAVVTLADIAGIAIDNAQLYEQVQSRREVLEHAVTGFEATTEIAQAVGAETDLARVLELIAKRGRALVRARSVAILLEEAGTLRISSIAGEVDEAFVGSAIELERSPYADVFRSGRPERVSDLTSRLDGSRAMLGIEATSALLVPLSFQGRPVGVLAAFDRSGDEKGFSSDDEHVLTSFAASAATAVATAKSVAADRLRHSIEAAEQERRRWARELHDETLQGLAGLNVLLRSGLESGGEQLTRAVEDATTHIEDQIAALRALITDLRPAVLDALGLEPAIDTLVSRVRAVEGIDVQPDLAREGPRLAPEIESTLYRLVQEALTNVGKHARADNAWIVLRDAGGHVTVEIRDDGVGFEPERPSAGFGLTGMRERVALAGGAVTIDSTPGAGTRVVASLPARYADDPLQPLSSSRSSA
jgi:signal transduction histidine kinase